MSSEMIMALVIITIVACIMLIIGICQFFKKDEPVGFYNLIDPPKSEDITDISAWNHKHGLIWIMYGLCIETGFGLGYVVKNEIISTVLFMGGVVFPLPLMIICHNLLSRKYHKR